MAVGCVTDYPQKGVARVIWPALAEAEEGQPAEVCRWHEKCVQIVSAGTASAVTIQGSNDGVEWATLHSKDSNAVVTGDGGGLVALSALGEGLFTILENPLYIRPITADDDGADVVVTLVGVAFD